MTVLPEPDSPTSANFSPGAMREVDAVDDLLAAEGDAQVLDVEQRPQVVSLMRRPFADRARRAARRP